eukprot:CAMPEP_0178993880 /NCGR_PEP_ID=MMETSP0795-20121207/6959_1 /TAXON_ID=88552 /ORGANISM="Amoebophrya sp., Strain Ameob2" /LENGTH=89 /DNA_ID=CAMNT_0020686009 /DNA_START=263 /DNA_END=532 /DNA_ORIENTATION=+
MSCRPSSSTTSLPKASTRTRSCVFASMDMLVASTTSTSSTASADVSRSTPLVADQLEPERAAEIPPFHAAFTASWCRRIWSRSHGPTPK